MEGGSHIPSWGPFFFPPPPPPPPPPSPSLPSPCPSSANSKWPPTLPWRSVCFARNSVATGHLFRALNFPLLYLNIPWGSAYSEGFPGFFHDSLTLSLSLSPGLSLILFQSFPCGFPSVVCALFLHLFNIYSVGQILVDHSPARERYARPFWGFGGGRRGGEGLLLFWCGVAAFLPFF